MVVAILAGAAYGFWNRSRPKILVHAIELTAAVGFVLFLPILILTGEIVDRVRYGTFQYESATEIHDPYVRIPASARDIILHKYASGHRARFSVEPADLTNWMASVVEARRKEIGQTAPFEEQNSSFNFEGRAGIFESRYSRTGWKMPPDTVWYQGWRSGRGSGFDVWYSPATREGFVDAAYW